MSFSISAQQEVARETSMPLLSKIGASHLLRGEMLGSWNRKNESKWWWLKDKEGRNPQKWDKGRFEDQTETLR